jgi:hypothetical protein
MTPAISVVPSRSARFPLLPSLARALVSSLCRIYAAPSHPFPPSAPQAVAAARRQDPVTAWFSLQQQMGSFRRLNQYGVLQPRYTVDEVKQVIHFRCVT